MVEDVGGVFLADHLGVGGLELLRERLPGGKGECAVGGFADLVLQLELAGELVVLGGTVELSLGQVDDVIVLFVLLAVPQRLLLGVGHGSVGLALISHFNDYIILKHKPLFKKHYQ